MSQTRKDAGQEKNDLIIMRIIISLLAFIAIAIPAYSEPCTFINSTVINSPNYSTSKNCTVINSTIIDSYIEDSSIRYSSINLSRIIDTAMRNSTARQANSSHSTIEYSAPCPGSKTEYSTIANNILSSGKFIYAGYAYFAPKNITNICAGQLPGTGVLTANKTIVKDGDLISFAYSGSIGSTVFLNVSELNSSSQLINLTYSSSAYRASWRVSSKESEVISQESALMGLWHFNNDTGYGENSTKIYDFSGNGNNGTCSGTSCPQFSSSRGKVGGAFVFDGSNDNFQTRSFNFTYITVEAWVNVTREDTGSYWAGAIANRDESSTTRNWMLYPQWSGGMFNFNWVVATNSTSVVYASTGNTTINQWHHVVGTFNGTMLSIYLDGVLSRNSSLVGNLYNNNNVIEIGARTGSMYDVYMQGAIDEVAIYNRSLSAAEVYAHYMLGREGQKQVRATINDNLGNTLYSYLNLTLDNAAPAGSILINYGEANTSSRNAMLNLNYTDANGIDTCRFANQSMITSAWEACAPTKSWMLSDGYGNKSIFAEIKDAAGNILLVNDTIIYIQQVLDNTPPSTPAVIDGFQGGDADYANSNTTLSARWSSIDYESYYLTYQYSILSNGTNITGQVDAGMATSVTVSGLSLSIGTNYSFQITVKNANNFSSTGYSDGIFLDLFAPSITGLSSQTHPLENATYQDAAAIFNWSATDDRQLAGYSYQLDITPTSEPDSIIDSQSSNASFENLLSGTYYFHLKAIDGAGNYAVEHRKIIVRNEGATISFDAIPDKTFSETINLTGTVSDQAFVRIYSNGIEKASTTANGTFNIEISLYNGTNIIHGTAYANNITMSTESYRLTRLPYQFANLSFTLSYAGQGSGLSKMAYYDSGSYIFGLASDSESTPSYTPSLSVSTNESASAYLFLARRGAELEKKNSLLDRKIFLDEPISAFGQVDLKYLVEIILSYDNFIFAENKTLSSGVYGLSIQNRGLDEDKKRIFLIREDEN